MGPDVAENAVEDDGGRGGRSAAGCGRDVQQRGADAYHADSEHADRAAENAHGPRWNADRPSDNADGHREIADAATGDGSFGARQAAARPRAASGAPGQNRPQSHAGPRQDPGPPETARGEHAERRSRLVAVPARHGPRLRAG